MGTLGRDASGCDGSDCTWIDCEVRGSARGASIVWSPRASSTLGGAGRGFKRIGIVGSWRSTTFDSGTRRGAAGALGAGREGGGKRAGGMRGGGGKRTASMFCTVTGSLLTGGGLSRRCVKLPVVSNRGSMGRGAGAAWGAGGRRTVRARSSMELGFPSSMRRVGSSSPEFQGLRVIVRGIQKRGRFGGDFSTKNADETRIIDGTKVLGSSPMSERDELGNDAHCDFVR
jgi:hypothetical protein